MPNNNIINISGFVYNYHGVKTLSNLQYAEKITVLLLNISALSIDNLSRYIPIVLIIYLAVDI